MKSPDLKVQLNAINKEKDMEVTIYYSGELVEFSVRQTGMSGESFRVSKEELTNLTKILSLLEDKPDGNS
ncbi:hypothetical protein IID22_03870 [Patescibacteria group bacterium]|nr:hypothetical protein [Patescibacteria group bacterium]